MISVIAIWGFYDDHLGTQIPERDMVLQCTRSVGERASKYYPMGEGGLAWFTYPAEVKEHTIVRPNSETRNPKSGILGKAHRSRLHGG